MEMGSKLSATESMIGIANRRGKEAIEKVTNEILASFGGDEILDNALRHFVQVSMPGAMPIFPALISLSCEAVGGNPKDTIEVGAAILLIAGAADVHDDIIDNSLTKGSKQTVFGRFGKETTLLVGDALLMRGMVILNNECAKMSKKQRDRILSLITQTSIEMSRAEILEMGLKGKLDRPLEEYFRIIEMKASVHELNMKIGAILGNGGETVVETMGQFGRTFGVVATVIEDFIDLAEYEELQNRLKNEVPPLPLLHALQNPKTRDEVISILENPRFSQKSAERITSTVRNSPEVQELIEQMTRLIRKEKQKLLLVTNRQTRKEMETLGLALLENLELLRTP